MTCSRRFDRGSQSLPMRGQELKEILPAGHHDPAAPLGMLTEPLGQLGYHFGLDGNRRVSAEAQQRRNMRNLWEHNMELGSGRCQSPWVCL